MEFVVFRVEEEEEEEEDSSSFGLSAWLVVKLVTVADEEIESTGVAESVLRFLFKFLIN